MNTFFTADSHYQHFNIIKYCNRPFSSVEEMDEALIENHNKVVGPKDEVYILGDFVFAKTSEEVESYTKRLNGKLYLIYGSHDRNVVRFSSGFVWKKEIAKIKVQGQRIILCHYAMRTWEASHYGTWNLFGHSHGKLEEFDNVLACDVGVDAWDFTPVSFDQIKTKMEAKNFVPINKRDKQ